MALKTTSTVISFIMLDGARNSSAFFSNSTLPLDASIRIAVGASPSKPPLPSWRPCTLLLAAYTIPPQPTASATNGRHQAAPRDDGRGVGFAGNGSLGCHRRCPESVRSNSWKYRKQHRFWTCRRVDPIAAPDEGTYRASSCNLSHKYEKQGGNAMPTSRTISANGIEFFVLEQGQGPLVLLCHGWPELSYSWRHQIPAIAEAGFHVVAPDMRGSAGPVRLPMSAPIPSSTMSATWSRWWRRSAKSRRSLSAMTGGAGRLARGDVPPRCLHQGRWPQRSTTVPRTRPSARDPEEERHHQFLLAVFPAWRKPSSSATSPRRCRSCWADAGSRIRPRTMFIQEGKGFLADADPHRPLPSWLTEADIAYFRRGLPEVRLSRRAELVSQYRSQLGTDGAVAGRKSTSRRCSLRDRRMA